MHIYLRPMKRFTYSVFFVMVSCMAYSHNGHSKDVPPAPNLFFAFGQQAQVHGKVIDKKTGKAIPHCNITVANGSIGASSNELGEFVIAIDALPAKLIFSHVEYRRFDLEFSGESDIVVPLVPLAMASEQIVAFSAKKTAFAVEWVKKAYEKAESQSTREQFGEAFYRQKSKNGDTDSYSEFLEIFYNIRYGTKGIENWNVIEGRYALKDTVVFNKNYTLLSQILRPLQPDTEQLIFPINPNFEKHYHLNVLDIIQSDDTKIAIVHFKPLKKTKTPIFEGTVYIDTDTYDILKISASLASDDLELVKLTTKKSDWKDYRISYEIAYKRNDSAISVLDYITVDQSFDYYKNNSFQYRSSTTSNLTFYEHYEPTSQKRVSPLRGRQEDWKKSSAFVNNEKFWADNPIVKRTPAEERAIRSFESEEAFEPIFLNSVDNMALMPSGSSNNPFLKALHGQMKRYSNYNPIEKVFLHTDKDLFSSGELLWFSAYVVLGPDHLYISASKVLHVDLIGPNADIILSQTHELVNGRGSGSLQLPKNLPDGSYQIRSYTQWMRNYDSDFFFTKNLEVLHEAGRTRTPERSEDKIDLQFFPEGGHLVADIPGKVAFKAIGSDGRDRTVSGQIINLAGKTVASLRTFSRGSGFFQLLPAAGEQYMAVLDSGAKYPLPKVRENGYALTVNNLPEKSIRINVKASESLRNRSFYVLAEMHQRSYFEDKFEFGTEPVLRFEIPKTKMPSGVLTITLFDESKRPRSERAVFINNQQQLVISTKIEEGNLAKRGKITLQVAVSDSDGKPVSTDLSIAVTDMGQVVKDARSGNAMTHLLLESDLRGHIANPGLLFKNQERATKLILDLVMLTHGWRKFNWPEIWEAQNQKKKFAFSQGLTLSGRARRLNRKALSNATLNLIVKSGERLGMLSTRTSDDGKFLIPDFNFTGETKIVFNALNSSRRPLNVKVALDKNSITLPPSQFRGPSFSTLEFAGDYLTFSTARTKMDSIYNFENITELDEVVVTEKKIEQGGAPSVFGMEPDASVYTANHISAQTVVDLVLRFSGVSLVNNAVSIRNRGTPLWVLNGIPINQGIASESMDGSVTAAAVPSMIATLDIHSVERVELLKGPRAAIWGSRGGNGVILIYTKKGVGRTVKPVLSPDFTVMGHALEREFYFPKYDVKHDEHDAPDYRATLYWNPSFTSDNDGRARLTFYNSDIAKQIQVHIEGISANGTPGTLLQTFGRQNHP